MIEGGIRQCLRRHNQQQSYPWKTNDLEYFYAWANMEIDAYKAILLSPFEGAQSPYETC